jgi:cytoskeleton protein RodZ
MGFLAFPVKRLTLGDRARMETLGVWLRQTREARDETLQDVEAATRIRLRFLQMLEEGEFDALPGGEVQVRGFLRIYARHLDLSPESVLVRYDREVRHVEVEPVVAPAPSPARPAPLAAPVVPPPAVAKPSPPRPSRPGTSPAVPQWLSLETIIIACIILIILLVIVIAAMYVVSRGRGSEEAGTLAPATASAGVLTLPTRTATPPAPTPTFPVDPDGYVMLKLDATEHVWVRVTVDGMTTFEGMMGLGQSEAWSGKEKLSVETGNGAGLQVTVNGQSQGAMCGRAERCVRNWGPEGEIVAP